MKRFRFRHGIRFLGFAILFLSLVGWIVMALWNALLPSILGVSAISWVQALGLLLLSRILFGGFGGRGFGSRGFGGQRYGSGSRGRFGSARYEWKQKMAERWSQMTPEQRQQMRQQWRDRCRQWGRGRRDEPKADDADKSEY
ncbi:hypothetical protein WBJ53_16780 [Spirosoma sp. SC4-14]|uniref:hypothetical protein n=1 Tax=Spirosoma sp. SC4-14 TaxID=3128900 RepID=UPI0030D3A018